MSCSRISEVFYSNTSSALKVIQDTLTDKVGEGDEAKLVTIPVAGHFLRRALGASTTDGGAWVDERIAKNDIAKPTSQKGVFGFGVAVP